MPDASSSAQARCRMRFKGWEVALPLENARITAMLSPNGTSLPPCLVASRVRCLIAANAALASFKWMGSACTKGQTRGGASGSRREEEVVLQES